jgi:hypothetical protein
MGGTGRDTLGSVKTDGSGNAYLFGIGTTGMPQLNPFGSLVSGSSASVTKFGPGGQLVYSTFLTLSGTPRAAAVTASGEAMLSFDSQARILRINSAGSGFVYNSTTHGATGLGPNSGATDSAGNYYACGGLLSTANVPATAGALHATRVGDGYLIKFSPSGQILFATYLPRPCEKTAVDSSNRMYVSFGATPPFSIWPLTATFGQPQPSNETPFVEVVARINAAGSALDYVTHFRRMLLSDLAPDPLSGAVYVAGQTAISQEVTLVNPLRNVTNALDGYIAKLNSTGTALIWATMVGGNQREDLMGIAVDPVSGAVAFAGDTSSTDLAAVSAVQSTSQRSSGCFTGFVGQINSAGTSLLFQSYFGGAACIRMSSTSSNDGMVAADNGSFYVAGEVTSTNTQLPVVAAAQGTYGGGSVDMILSKFGATSGVGCTFSLGAPSTSIGSAGGNGTVNVNTQAGCAFSASTSSNFITVTSGTPGNGSGTVGFNVAANSGAARSGTILIAGQTFTVNQSAAPPTLISASPNPAIIGSSVFLLTGTGFDPATAQVEINGGTIIANSAMTTKTATQLVFRTTLSAGTHSFVVRNVSTGQATNAITVTAAAPVGSHFVPIAPCRAADTRNAGSSILARDSFRDFTLSACGIPSNATAVALNITLVPTGQFGFISIWPAGQAQPTVSTMNSLDGRIKANASIVGLGAGQAVSIYVTDPAHVILDVNGYFVPEGTPGALAFYPVTPCRVVDTRVAGGGGIINANTTRRISGGCLPSNAQAYSLNVTTVPSGPLGFLTLFPDGTTQPLASTLNNLTGTVVANAAILRAGTGGAFQAFVTDNSHLIVDLNGYFAPPGQPGALSFFAMQPCRIFDTRLPSGAFGGPVMARDSTRNFTVPSSGCAVPTTAQAYMTNATVVPPAVFGFLTLFPGGQPRPTVSTLNAIDGALHSNAAIVPAGAGGVISIYTSDQTHLLLDISGYFAPATIIQ